MNVDLYLEVWQALRPHLIGVDVAEAADDFVHVLIEHGIAAEDVAEYTTDPDIKAALRAYVELEEDEDYEDEDEDGELNFS